MGPRERITRFGLRNFKAFHYLEDIEIRPLTILVGANSTGKSSILQSLLLLKQTSTAGRFGGALKFDGDLVRLGNFDTVISGFDASRTLEYRFAIDLLLTPEQIRQMSIKTPPAAQGSGEQLARAEVHFQFGAAEHVRLESLDVGVRLPGMEEETSHGAVLRFDRRESHISIQNGHSMLPIEFDFSGAEMELDKFWPTSIRTRMRRSAAQPSEAWRMASVPLQVFTVISKPLEVLQQVLIDELEYLGPIRADPRPFYPVQEDPDIGPRGEGTIPFLLRHKDDPVRYLPSPTAEPREASLLTALNHWLQAMQVTSRLTIDPLESIAYTAAVQARSVSSRAVNLAQVGFGVSQLLPVLVMGLKPPADACVLYEQPEIHLHPRLQGELGDFLLCVARGGKTVLVETHSEHLINRVRRRIAEDETGELAKLVQILFVHPGTEDNPSSYIEPLEVDETGTIVNCPPDFFPEAADEAFAILRARQRKTGRPPAP